MKCLGCGGACKLTESVGPMWAYECLVCSAANERLQTIHGTYVERARHAGGWSCQWRKQERDLSFNGWVHG